MARAAPSYPQPAGEIVAWPLRLLVIVGIAESDFCAFAEEELDELPEAFRKICGLVPRRGVPARSHRARRSETCATR